jgi:hypothetical protein
MNRQALFVKSVDILVDAYKKGNLTNGESCNCAVGNLIAYRKGTYHFNNEWFRVIYKIRKLHWFNKKKIDSIPSDALCPLADIRKGFDDIKQTEYTPQEIEKIERAFEKQSHQEDDEMDSRPGLLRSIKVLGEIHNVPKNVIECMQDKVKTDTYKFSYKFRKKNKFMSCPTVKPL